MIEIVYNTYKHEGLIIQQYTGECYACQQRGFHISCQLEFLTWGILFSLEFIFMKVERDQTNDKAFALVE